MKKKINVLGLFLFFLLIVSCASKKNVVYFQGVSEISSLYELNIPKIQSNDILAISVSSSNIKATEPFNQQSIYASNVNPNSPYKSVYIVGADGNIDFPILGKVYLLGKTRNEAIQYMKELLSEYIVDPGVNIQYTNFKVSVIGEVKQPGSFVIQNERITIFEALALAGDLTINGVRKEVYVIREVNGVRNVYVVDLTAKEILDSPVYYLAQNDVVYVMPNQSKIQSSVINYPVFISVAGILISVVALLIK